MFYLYKIYDDDDDDADYDDDNDEMAGREGKRC